MRSPPHQCSPLLIAGFCVVFLVSCNKIYNRSLRCACNWLAYEKCNVILCVPLLARISISAPRFTWAEKFELYAPGFAACRSCALYSWSRDSRCCIYISTRAPSHRHRISMTTVKSICRWCTLKVFLEHQRTSRVTFPLLIRRGRRQYLHTARFEEMRKTWLGRGIPTLVARKLEAVVENGGWETL